MRTAGIIIIALACLGMLLSFVSQVGALIIQGARSGMGVTRLGCILSLLSRII